MILEVIQVFNQLGKGHTCLALTGRKQVVFPWDSPCYALYGEAPPERRGRGLFLGKRYIKRWGFLELKYRKGVGKTVILPSHTDWLSLGIM